MMEDSENCQDAPDANVTGYPYYGEKIIQIILPEDEIVQDQSRPSYCKAHFQYTYFVIKPLSEDRKNNDEKVPFLLLTNHNHLPRRVAVFLRSYKELTKFRSMLRHFCKLIELPNMPSGSTHKMLKTEIMKAFIRWCACNEQVINLKAVQLFLYTNEPMKTIKDAFELTRNLNKTEGWNSKGYWWYNNSRHLPEVPVIRQDYERKYLNQMDLSTEQQRFKYTSLGGVVEMGIDSSEYMEKDFEEDEYTHIQPKNCSDLLFVQRDEDFTNTER